MSAHEIPAAVERASQLSMSEWLVLGGLGLALVFALDPLDLALDMHRLTKHIPFALVLMGCWLTAVGAALGAAPSRRPEPQIVRHAWPFLVLGGWIVTGSLTARLGAGHQNTFLVAGLYMLTVPALAYVVIRAPGGIRNLRVYMALLVASGLFIAIGLAVTLDGRSYPYPFHELEFLPMPLAVYFAMCPAAQRSRSRLLLWIFLLTGLLFLKNTGFLVSALTFAYLVVLVWGRRVAADRRLRRSLIMAVIGVSAALVLVLTTVPGVRDYLPSGNPGFRLITYEIAWNRFLSSPVWGAGFTQPASEKFLGFDTGIPGNVLPTHSDVLDLLAHGGLMAIALLGFGYWNIARAFYRRQRRAPLSPEAAAIAHTAACMLLAGVVVYAFNPIMLQPVKVLLMWTSGGILLGLALRPERTSSLQGGTTP